MTSTPTASIAYMFKPFKCIYPVLTFFQALNPIAHVFIWMAETALTSRSTEMSC